MTIPHPEPGLYQHYKGNRYDVLYVGQHTETREQLVVYRAIEDPATIWVRPLSMFVEDVEVDGQKVPRFLKLNG